MKENLKIRNVNVTICDTREEMGKEAASFTGMLINKLLEEKEYINMVFAAAPSQDEFLASLVSNKHIDFSRINAFHMDEYIGLDKNSSKTFSYYLETHLFSKVPFHSVNFINGSNVDSIAECKRYSGLIADFPPDIVCAGVGENGHIAFNDPSEADFNDPMVMKIVRLDEVCRQQQVNDGCFDSICEVPQTAMTLTIPTLMNAKKKVFVIPSMRKAHAVLNMFSEPKNINIPASVIQGDNESTVFLDNDSSSLLIKQLKELKNG